MQIPMCLFYVNEARNIYTHISAVHVQSNGLLFIVGLPDIVL